MADLPANINQVGAKYSITDAGYKLLDVVMRPECRSMTITKQCEIAGISRVTYYSLFKDESFKKAYTELCQTMLLAAAAPASHALASQGAMGDVNAIKIILEMASIYQPTTKVEHTHTVEAGQSLLDMYKTRQKAIT